MGVAVPLTRTGSSHAGLRYDSQVGLKPAGRGPTPCFPPTHGSKAPALRTATGFKRDRRADETGRERLSEDGATARCTGLTLGVPARAQL